MNYISDTYTKWKGMFLKAKCLKERFVRDHKGEFYTAFIQEANDFAREIFLDPA